jgi:hypothetical protein
VFFPKLIDNVKRDDLLHRFDQFAIVSSNTFREVSRNANLFLSIGERHHDIIHGCATCFMDLEHYAERFSRDGIILTVIVL